MTVVKYLLLIHFSKMNKSYSALKSNVICLVISSICMLPPIIINPKYKQYIRQDLYCTNILTHIWNIMRESNTIIIHLYLSLMVFLTTKAPLKVQESLRQSSYPISFICNARHYPFGKHLFAIFWYFSAFPLSFQESRETKRRVA